LSLDDTYEQMRQFYLALREFNESLRVSVADVNQKHMAVDPLWQDSFRRRYDAEYQSFLESMTTYLNRESWNYAQFLEDKIQELGQYLNG
jgi:uncharacterized protein YukE